MIVLTALAVLAWPGRPAPVSAASAWSQRAAPVEDALATDVASATERPTLSPAMTARLRRDLERAERIAPPQDQPRAEVWRQVLGQVGAALGQARPDPPAARANLEAAALELPLLSAQEQSRGMGGPKGPTAG